MKVLVAADRAQESRDAIRFAAELLGADDEAIVLHVESRVLPAAWTFTPMDMGYIPPSAMSAMHEEREHERAAVEDEVEPLDDLEPEVVIERGDAAKRICELAESEHVDLIVLGTHDRNAFGRLWYGSVSTDVVHHAPCSVLVVR